MKGFSLVEMLVALLVFGLLSAAGVAVMAYTVDNQGIVGARMDRLGEFQRARSLIKQDLAQAAPRRVRQPDGTASRSAFAGAPMAGGDVLMELTRRGWANPEEEPRASLQHVQYRLSQGKLLRQVSTAIDGVETARPQLLLTGVTSVRISYRHRGQWLDGWPGGRELLPEAVRLDLDLEGLGELQQLFLVPGAAL